LPYSDDGAELSANNNALKEMNDAAERAIDDQGAAPDPADAKEILVGSTFRRKGLSEGESLQAVDAQAPLTRALRQGTTTCAGSTTT